jgi:solute carrier family 35 protein C2
MHGHGNDRARRLRRKVLTVAGGVVVFADELSPLNVVGLCVSAGGIVLYNVLRHRATAAADRRAADRSVSSGASGGSEVGLQTELAEAEALFGAGGSVGMVPLRKGPGGPESDSARRELWDSDEDCEGSYFGDRHMRATESTSSVIGPPR